VNTAEFRLKFLRCELFDAKKAAARLVSFLDFLMDVFDDKEDLLLRPMRMSDFDKNEYIILKTGNFQLLPFRDRSGRRIVTISDLSLSLDFEKTCKVLMYLMHVASENVESQKRGVIFIIISSKISFSVLPSPDNQRFAQKMNDSFPIRLVAMHFCIPETMYYRMLQSIVLLSHTSETRFRYKTHFGKLTEWHYALMGYGVPPSVLPISQEGVIKTSVLQQWIRVRKSIENRSQDRDDADGPLDQTIECPNMNDIIFRTGKSYVCHPGNVMFRSLIESKTDEHFAASRSEKAVIAWWIVREVERRGGRFLRWDSRGWWTEIKDRSEIRYKIPTYFRDFRRNMKARRNRTAAMMTQM